MDFTTGAGLLLTAGILGITHGIEPDHVAGITALTHERGDPKLSALVGGCFAAGHVALVVIWIVLAYVLLGTTAFPPIFEQFGLLLVGIVLSLLGLYLGITGTRKLIHRHAHNHCDESHVHYHLHLPLSIRTRANHHGSHVDGLGEHSHRHGVLEYLKIGFVGALFTLSPPVSMLAFTSVALAETDVALLPGVVVVYGVTIIATMTLIGGGAGALFRVSTTRGQHFHAVSQVVASVLVLGVAGNLLADLIPELLA
jgi:hypothetical protein